MSDPTIRAGTIGYPMDRSSTTNAVDLVELTDAFTAPPRAAVGRRQRAQTPGRVDFSVQLPRYLFETPPARSPFPGVPERYGRFQTTEENLRLMQRALQFAGALEARTLVLLTPADFTPAQSNRASLAGFLRQFDFEELELVWEPRGPWEHETASDYARELGLTLAVDPLRDPPVRSQSAYFRLGPFSTMGSRLGVYDLERIAAACEGFSRVTCVFGTPRALDDVRNFKQILQRA